MRENGQAIVTVRDHGIGIPDEVLPRVFDMFTQADRPIERSKGGLGVGLTLVKQLVELHNGSVEARSEGPGRGSEFVVRLPLMAEAPEGRVQNTFTDREVSLMRQRVLIVDDNRDAADTLAMMLEIMGNEVRTAYDGMEALQVGSELRPDVVLLDIGLPGLNGYEAARRIRAEPWGSRSLLIALTGWGQSEDRRRSREAGFDHHVVKPVAAGTLMELLASSRSSQLRAPMGSQPNVYPTQAEVADIR
jgi:CheY-like chemotaxis protein